MAKEKVVAAVKKKSTRSKATPKVVEDHRKYYALDTNVLIFDPHAMLKLGDNHILIPLPVLEELDSFKKGQDSRAQAAREVNRRIDELRVLAEEQGTYLFNGVTLDHGGTITVMTDVPGEYSLHPGLDSEKMDNLILHMILERKKSLGRDVVLISKDCNMRIKGDVLGIRCEDYKNSIVVDDGLYDPIPRVDASHQQVANIHEGFASLVDIDDGLVVNDYAMLNCHPDSEPTLVRVVDDEEFGSIYQSVAEKGKQKAFKLIPKNLEQRAALDALLDPNISCVSLVGRAGGGKTVVALAAALEQVINSKTYDKIVICRPVVPLGRDIGFLPGSLKEKLLPWLMPIYDNFEVLFKDPDERMRGKKGVDYLEEMGIVEFQALTYLRGRSINKAFIIIDEAQNLTPHEVKTIVTRAGQGTKIVLNGDPYQIDNPYIDSHSNGLSHLISAMKGQGCYANINFTKVERSELSEIAGRLL